jgi:hypothetical protein
MYRAEGIALIRSDHLASRRPVYGSRLHPHKLSWPVFTIHILACFIRYKVTTLLRVVFSACVFLPIRRETVQHVHLFLFLFLRTEFGRAKPFLSHLHPSSALCSLLSALSSTCDSVLGSIMIGTSTSNRINKLLCLCYLLLAMSYSHGVMAKDHILRVSHLFVLRVLSSYVLRDPYPYRSTSNVFSVVSVT